MVSEIFNVYVGRYIENVNKRFRVINFFFFWKNIVSYKKYIRFSKYYKITLQHLNNYLTINVHKLKTPKSSHRSKPFIVFIFITLILS